jgi:hypothetical protein
MGLIIKSLRLFYSTSVQREPGLKATSHENNSPVKYQCRENVEMLGNRKLLGALSKGVLI